MLRKNYNFISIFNVNILVFSLSCVSAIIFGIIPEINWQSKTINFENQVLAQSDAELQKYAQAAKEIENLRKSTFSQIEAKVGKDKANQLACNQANSINQLPEDARSLAQNYCTQSEAIVQKHGLSISQFNQITQQRKSDSSLDQKIQNMISP